MTPEQKAAFIIAQAACASAEIAGMTAENMQREQCGHSMAYVEDSFLEVIQKYGLHHNAVITFFAE